MDRGLAVLYRKELADHIHSLRSLVLAALVALTSLASLFTAAQALRAVVPTAKDPSAISVFLIAVSSGANNLPSLASFVGFLAPLLGLGMSFDAISSERNRRTLLRLLAQPIYRDDVILAKWLAALTVVGVFFFALGVLVVGLAIFFFGVPPEGEELLRFFTYLAATVVYVAVWISFGVLLSLLFRQPSTSILIGLAAWLYFVLFHPLLVNLFVPVDEGAPRTYNSGSSPGIKGCSASPRWNSTRKSPPHFSRRKSALWGRSPSASSSVRSPPRFRIPRA